MTIALLRGVAAAAILGAAFAPGAFAQDEAEETEEEEGLETIESYVEDLEAQPGLFPLYSDPETGALYMEVAEDQFDDPFIYFLYTENGAPRIGHNRGRFRDNRVFSVNKRFGQIEFEAENTNFHFDPDNALSRAADANITRAPLAVADIVAETPASGEGEAATPARYLIDAGAILRTEALHQVTPFTPSDVRPGERFSLGKLDGDKTTVREVRNYPENTDVIVEYVYDNPTPQNFGGPEITDARSVAVLVQHSFIAAPETDYAPRRDDFRVGFFGQRVDDLTDASFTPYEDVINRWNLVKADPDAAVSDPVEPITFWIENTTPVELRDTIREAALTWNTAFEAAGISNAIEVRVQPDDADWDAGDIRYNVMRWTSSPTPPFGGYGPSFTDPRTGQILGADIMLEYVFLTNRVAYSEIFELAGLPMEFHGEDAPTNFAPHLESDAATCNFAGHLQSELITARAALQARGASEVEMNALIEQALSSLIVHEIGHTIGLMHNMAGSASIPYESLQESEHISGSVMDYAALNLARIGEPQGFFDQPRPGPYDIWAVQYGYTPSLDDPEAEAERVEALLSRSTEKALLFGNDADDMRAPGRHIDPRVMTSDLTDDPVRWADDRITLVNETLAALPERMTEEGETYQGLYTAYLILTGQRASAASVASRWVGGVYNNRAAIGQEGADTPFVPVDLETQKRALDVLERGVFAPDAFAPEQEIADLLQRQRRLFDHFGRNEDPSLHERAIRIQTGVLAHLLHPNVLTRMTDARQYGGEYPVADYLADLTSIMFDADINGLPNTYRQNLQIAYANALVAGVQDGSYDPVARSAMLQAVIDIENKVGPNLFNMFNMNGPREARAHRAHILAITRQVTR